MIIGAIIIGCITGFVSSFFGIGGSSIDTPLLRTFLHFPPYLALGTPLPTAFLTIFIALATYWKSHLVNFRVFKYSLLGGLPGITIGSYFSRYLSGKTLMLLTGIILLFVGMDFIIKSIRDRKKNPDDNPQDQKIIPAPFIAGLSAITTFVSGILANGGGLFLIPTYVILFGMRIKEAIATSLLVVAVMVLPSCLIHYQLGHIDIGTSAAMGIGVLPMAIIGAKLDLRTKSNTIQTLFGIMLVIFAIYFFTSQIKIN